MRRLDARRFWLFSFVSAVSLVVTASIAYAGGGGGSGVILGCAKNLDGQLRIVVSASDCLASEHLVEFQAPIASGPQSAFVDCTQGQSVNQALAATAAASSVNITIKGICTESVRIARDNVSLQGADASSGLQQPAGAGVVLDLGGRHINLNQLLINGGMNGVQASAGVVFNANNLTVTGPSNIGILAGNTSSGFVSNSTVDGAQEGLNASTGGTLAFSGGVIKNSSVFGAHANGGSSIFLNNGAVVTGSPFQAVSAQDGGAITINGATIQNSGTGLFAFAGGSIHFQAGTVQNNNFAAIASAGTLLIGGRVTGNQSGVSATGGHVVIQDGASIDNNQADGVFLTDGSNLFMQNATVSSNTGNGVHLGDTSVAQFGFQSNDTITNNGGMSVFCDGPPAVAQIRVGGGIGTVSGNHPDQSNCPVSG